MAVTTTALDFKVPDGNELVNGGDNLIGHNAQAAQNAIAADRVRLGSIETTNVTQGNRITYVEAAVAAGGTGGGTGGGSTLTPDPDNAGLYFIV